MAAPRSGLNPATHSVGFTVKLVTVQSVTADGLTAITVDRQHTETRVPMLVQRSKGELPAAGETWLLTQDLGMWTFAAFVGASPAKFAGGSAGTERLTISAIAPLNPATGDVWINEAVGGEILQWRGTWTQIQLSGGAIADGSLPATKIVPGSITTAQISPNAGITAGQVAFSTEDIGGVRFFRGPQPPLNPQPGDFWYNSLLGNVLAIWDGNAWDEILLGAPAIANGSLTADQLSAEAGIGPSQVAFNFRDIGGMTVSLQIPQPASPLVGDLWYDQSNGFALRQWDGTAWVPYQYGTGAIAARSITAELIAAGTITAQHLAAGVIYAGIVNGTQINAATFTGSTFQGLDFIINTKGAFFYSGVPASGNMVASVAGVAGTDSVGNPYPVGVNSYFTTSGVTYAVGLNFNRLGFTPGLAIQDVASPPYSPPGVFGQGSAAHSQAVAILSSGMVNASPDTEAYVSAQSQVNFGGAAGVVNAGTNGVVEVNAGQVLLGGVLGLGNVTAIVDDNNNLLRLPVAATPGAPGAGSGFYNNTDGTPSWVNANGARGAIPATQAVQGGNTNSTTSMNAMFTPFPIPANDAATGTTVYRVTCGGHGTQATGTAVALNFQLQAFGQAWGGSADTGGIAAGDGFHWRFTGELIVKSNGAASFTGQMTMSQATSSAQGHPTAMDTQVTTGTLTLTGATNVTLQAGWASITGGPTLVCTGAVFERLGS